MEAAKAGLAAVTALGICLVTSCGSSARPNPLTGIGTAGRVLAVKIDNVGVAQSQQRGLNGADVVYVEQVEGGLSRYLAVYDSSHRICRVSRPAAQPAAAAAVNVPAMPCVLR